ncbi:MAG TPA: 4-hydroxybenzoate octaprenyltransferase [Lichenihabitans sp.]|nr:4-hydroxybenzoate octaprenyltransferase [Lichenihabitans sp.]
MPDAASGLFSPWPAPLRPFVQLARIDRPIGWQLLLLPCWWGSALASAAAGLRPNPVHLVLFMIGAIVMRGAGSTFNDLVDRDLDRKVERTRGRPLASGRLGVRTALAFLVVQALIGLAVLVCFNRFTIGLGLLALVPVAVYPFMKRITDWPQIVLGLAFAWGALVGWSAIFGSLSPVPILLYLGAILWTMGYDTIYAMQDIADDTIVGIGSTAIAFGSHVRLGVAGLYAAAVLASTAALGWAGAGPLAWAGLAGFAIHLGWQVSRMDHDDPRRALRLFRANRDAGLILFAGLAAQALLGAH